MENIVENKWISVSEKMPENMQEVVFVEKLESGKQRKHLGFLNKSHYEKGYRDYSWESKFYELEFEDGSKVTHWMPIPELPTT